MDLLDVAILLLRIALVALLYLFLALVLRGAMRSFRSPPAGAGAAVRGAESPKRLVLTLVEPAESGHAAGERIDVWPTNVLGRSAPSDVVLADRAISAQHARFDRTAERWVVTDLHSTNGTRVNGRAVRGATRLQSGDVLEVGAVRFEVSDTP